VEAVGKFVPVPDVPKRFNDQLLLSATRLAVAQGVRGRRPSTARGLGAGV
jgi:hypothetical protein